MYMARIAEDGQVLWKAPMTDIENVSEELEHAKPNHRLLCHNYRLLLPNLGPGVRPPRNLFWVRRCMRAILHAKAVDDSSLASRDEPSIRFPELVYSWFQPDYNEEDELSIETIQVRRARASICAPATNILSLSCALPLANTRFA